MNTYEFEKNKLYKYLGESLVGKFKDSEVFIAGGAITSIFNSMAINDIDVYFRSEESMIEALKSIWKEDDDWIHALTEKSLLVLLDEKAVQFIHFKYFKSSDDLFNSFDFTACMGVFDFKTEEFILHDDFLRHNSQRILRFNKQTEFPIVSLLRVQKYVDRGYNISKPEFIRIALSCMKLNIQNIEDLKLHLGGMYGASYEKIIGSLENEAFSLDEVIDKISDFSLSDEYFKEPTKIQFQNLDDVINKILKQKIQIVKLNNKYYKLAYDETLRPINIDEIENYEEVNPTYIDQQKFYKFVSKTEDKYFSHYDRSFEYVVGKYKTPSGNDYLYFNEKAELLKSTYYRQGVLLEVEISHKDFANKFMHGIKTSKCFVVREVPETEWKEWI